MADFYAGAFLKIKVFFGHFHRNYGKNHEKMTLRKFNDVLRVNLGKKAKIGHTRGDNLYVGVPCSFGNAWYENYCKHEPLRNQTSEKPQSVKPIFYKKKAKNLKFIFWRKIVKTESVSDPITLKWQLMDRNLNCEYMATLLNRNSMKKTKEVRKPVVCNQHKFPRDRTSCPFTKPVPNPKPKVVLKRSKSQSRISDQKNWSTMFQQSKNGKFYLQDYLSPLLIV